MYRHPRMSNEDNDKLQQDPLAQQLRDWGHKLQRGFLGPQPPKSEDMPMYSELFSAIENLDMDTKYLVYTKIEKIMRHIRKVNSSKISREDEFHFKERAQALCNKWTERIPNGRNEDAQNPILDSDWVIINKKEVEAESDETVDHTPLSSGSEVAASTAENTDSESNAPLPVDSEVTLALCNLAISEE